MIYKTNKYSDLTNKELIDILIDIYNETGKSPRIQYMQKKNNVPSSVLYFKRFNTTKWNDILQIAKLPISTTQKNTKEEALIKLTNYCKKLGHIPTQKEFRLNKWKPVYTWYTKTFGSFEQACYEAKLIKKPLTEKEKIDISIKEFIELGVKLKKCPTRKEYDEYKKEGFCITILQKHLKMNLNDLCKKFLPQFKVNAMYDITNDEIKQIIINLINKINKVPMYAELKKYGIDLDYNLFQRRFGGYNNFIKEIGYLPKTTHIIKNDDELLEDFYNLYVKLKRIPTRNDIKMCHGMASHKTYLKRFKTIENICNLINIDLEDYINKETIGTKLYDKNKNVCKSIRELIISNFFIDNNIKFEKEVLYEEIFTNDKRRFDWKIYINNNIYYIEYFGIYSRYNNSNIIKLYNKKTRRKIKKIYKAGYINNCIFLFPNNYKNIIHIIENLLNKKVNTNAFNTMVVNNKLSDKEIANKLIEYSENKNILPSYRTLIENNLYHFYYIILKKYGTYENFGNIMGLKTRKRHKSIWNEDKVFEAMNYFIEKYGQIPSINLITKESKNNKELKGFVYYTKVHGGFLLFKLNYLYEISKTKSNFPKNEIDFLIKIKEKIFPYGQTNKSQRDIANLILNNILKPKKVAV